MSSTPWSENLDDISSKKDCDQLFGMKNQERERLCISFHTHILGCPLINLTKKKLDRIQHRHKQDGHSSRGSVWLFPGNTMERQTQEDNRRSCGDAPQTSFGYDVCLHPKGTPQHPQPLPLRPPLRDGRGIHHRVTIQIKVHIYEHRRQMSKTRLYHFIFYLLACGDC